MADTSDGVSGSNTEPNSAPCPPAKLENSPPSKNVELKYVNTNLIFNIDKNRFESGGNEHDKDNPTPAGDKGDVVVQIEEDSKQCS